MIASLPMYIRPELNDTIDQFWVLIRRNLADVGISAPEKLSQTGDVMTTWLDPTLVLSQTCGMPYRNHLHGKVQLVGTPDYDLEDCPAGHYYSEIIVRSDDRRQSLAEFADAAFAFNEEGSQSGFAAPLNFAAQNGISFGNRVVSGGHLNSAKMVAGRQADIAGIDAISWKLIERHEGFAKSLRILERTTPTTPVLPLITSFEQDADLVFGAVEAAIAALPQDLRTAMCLKGILKVPASEYLSVSNPE